jgi:hypothetical protein
MVVFAHAGHWLPQLLYLAPVLAMIGAVGLGKLRERRRKRPGTEPIRPTPRRGAGDGPRRGR